jgi:hypothetical protein
MFLTILCSKSVSQPFPSRPSSLPCLDDVDDALAKNTDKRQVHFGHSQNMAVLARQLQNAHTEKDRQINSVLTRVSLQEQAMLKANK